MIVNNNRRSGQKSALIRQARLSRSSWLAHCQSLGELDIVLQIGLIPAKRPALLAGRTLSR